MPTTNTHHDQYIVNLLRAKAAGAVAESAAHSAIAHTTVVGRAREILVGQLLAPFLPPGQSCVTGQVIDKNGPGLRTTQDDVVLFDSTIATPIRFGPQDSDGLYPYEGALLRIEVKSTLRSGDFDQFVKSSLQISRLRVYCLGIPDKHPGVTGCMNAFFSWSSDVADVMGALDKAFSNANEPPGGVVSFVCCADRGLWKLGERGWETLLADDEYDRIAWFVGCVSNMSYLLRMERQGLAKLRKFGDDGSATTVCVGGGIGNYLPDDVWGPRT